MCAVNAGGCVIDLFVQGWASTSSLLCLVTGNNASTDNSSVSTSPFCIPPYQAWRVAGGRWKITSETLTLFRRTALTGNRTRVASVIGHSVTTRLPRRWSSLCRWNKTFYSVSPKEECFLQGTQYPHTRENRSSDHLGEDKMAVSHAVLSEHGIKCASLKTS